MKLLVRIFFLYIILHYYVHTAVEWDDELTSNSHTHITDRRELEKFTYCGFFSFLC